jgi:hypothetical protein
MQGALTLNTQEQQRVMVLNRILAGHLSVGEAAPVLNRSIRQGEPYSDRYRKGSGSLEKESSIEMIAMKKEQERGLMHGHRLGKRHRHAHKTGQPLAQGVIPALHMSGFFRLCCHRRVLLLRDDRSIHSQKGGSAMASHNR